MSLKNLALVSRRVLFWCKFQRSTREVARLKSRSNEKFFSSSIHSALQHETWKRKGGIRWFFRMKFIEMSSQVSRFETRSTARKNTPILQILLGHFLHGGFNWYHRSGTVSNQTFRSITPILNCLPITRIVCPIWTRGIVGYGVKVHYGLSESENGTPLEFWSLNTFSEPQKRLEHKKTYLVVLWLSDSGFLIS